MFPTALTEFLARRGKSLAYVGTVVALTGAGVGTAVATTSSSATPQIASAVQHLSVGKSDGLHQPTANVREAAGGSAGAAFGLAASGQVPSRHAPSGHAPSGHAAPSTAAAHRPHHPAVRVRLASRKRPLQQAAGQHPARTQHQATAQAALRHRAPSVTHAPPYLIYDSVTPAAIPAHHVVATYATGNYAASPSQVAGRKVMWIDTTGTDYAASILDVEPGDATPSGAASWALHRLSARPNALARIYTMRSEWPAVQAAVATLPARMRSHIRWWIADPTGSPHIVPGSDATQWYWGSSYDITTATPRF
ncbi:MAG TPA: hypothetical protein VMV07_25880 [Streptosporangiaceae bacterium]|nr:hypothetical protein [Streptosporangiaceae bacterium]